MKEIRALVSLALLWAAPVNAEPVADFYKGKSVTLYVCGPAGGGYDMYGRVLARHLGRHLPGNPAMVVSNMPGAGGIICANFLANAAAKDGTAIGLLVQSSFQEQFLGKDNVHFDAAKFGWIGRMSSNVEITYVWHTTGASTVHDLIGRDTLLATYAPSTVIFPTLLNEMAGTRFRFVRGFRGTPDSHLAMERGEVEGATSSLHTVSATAGDWLQSGKIRILVQYVVERHPSLPEVPAVVEFGNNVEDGAILRFFASAATVGRALAAPAEIPAERLAALRSATLAALADEQLLTEAKQARMAIEPLPGRKLQDLITKAVDLPPVALGRVLAIPQR